MNRMRFIIIAIITLLSFNIVQAQPGAEIEVKKPKKYENRKLASERTGEKKFTIPRKFYQNTVTHYNYYFNANNRLNEIVTAAKTAFKEDYSQLLPFYNYSLDATAQSKSDLDSVIYKCTAGILLHDLRNSWIDNMYLLLAKAYFFRKDLDSSELTLQYVNFAYAPKEEGNYDKPIGSNVSNDKGEFSIATKEKNSIWTKLTSRPPSRNESFIWQIRTHIEKDQLPEASGVIEILRNDPNFPKRLQTDLDEVIAYWFYKQQVYDSAAIHLSKALNEAGNKQEKARWEYLIAQMYQLSKKYDDAVDYYNRCISHTTDPVMDVYARLNSIRIKRSDKTNYLQENINALLKMAKRDKYQSYRDIIYYAAAKIELERNNFNNAQDDLLKSVKFSTNNPSQRSQSFLLLADINFNRQSFPEAYNFYDSLDINSLGIEADKERVIFRKPPLLKISENTLIIKTQDSLQSLAKLPAAKRDAIIKRHVKLFRKAQGLKEEDPGVTNTAVKQVPDLFSNNNKSSDFYFYNASQKARGFSEFKARWGERPNVDNWRRKSALDRQIENVSDVEDSASMAGADEQKASDNSYEGLQQNIPLTAEKLDASNKSIMSALFTLGQTFVSPLEEYPSAIKAYEELLRRFPNTSNRQEAWFNLIYAYQKSGNKAKSEEYKNQLLRDTAQSKWGSLIKNPDLVKNNVKQSPATKKYEEIYNLFIEGKFDQARSEKKVADDLYGNSFWTPQLLYIEAIYYIKQQEDSTAINVLTDLSNLYGDNPIAEKAKTMISVLKRRAEIVDYLTKLNVSRNENNQVTTSVQDANTTPKPATKSISVAPEINDDTLAVENAEKVASETEIASNDTATVQNDTETVRDEDTSTVQNDTEIVPDDDTAIVENNTEIIADEDTAVVQNDTEIVQNEDSAIVQNDTEIDPSEDTAIVQNDTEIVQNEDTSTVQNDTGVVPNEDTAIVQNDTEITSNDNIPVASDTAIVSNDTEPMASDTAIVANDAEVPKDTATVSSETEQAASDTATVSSNKEIVANGAAPMTDNRTGTNDTAIVSDDESPADAAAPVRLKNFSFVPADSQYVAILLDNVDKVYASEAGNAFNRFNREKYYNQKIEINNLQLNERFYLVLQGPFADANAAIDYVDKVRPVAKSRIVPWLTVDKYSFLVISNTNLEVLKSGQDMDSYKQLLQKALPGKF